MPLNRISRGDKSYAGSNHKTRTRCTDHCAENFHDWHYNVTNIDDVWEADLIELRNLKSYNNDYSYLLVLIDVLSKYVWVEPLRDKTSNCVIKVFHRVLAKSEGRVYLQTDKNKEFVA